MITHASLFSGIGAGELAAEWMGWRNVFNCEINPFCREVLNYWFPNSVGYEDITKTHFDEWRGRIDVLSAGWPCQPFSVAGSRRGTEDDRFLWPEALRAIAEVEPSYVVGENVAGILSDVQPSDEVEVAVETTLFGENRYTSERRQFVVERICGDFERKGYTVIPFVIPACAVGAPHRRDRVWFIAKHYAADSQCRRGREVERDVQPRASDVEWADGDGCERTAADSEGRRPGELRNEGEKEGTRHRHELLGECGRFSREGEPARRWRDFPTAEPVIRVGNDGLPIGVPAISIPFPRWKNEALKALGNSMVPQLVYELFKAVEEDIAKDLGQTKA